MTNATNDSNSFRGRRLVRETLETLCCPSLQFMWNNSLLSPREEIDTGRDPFDGEQWFIRTLAGMRVVRDFGFLKRDQVLYRCPFCDVELISPLGYVHGERQLILHLTEIGTGVVKLHFPRAQLERWLKEAKARNRAGWPPKD